MRKVCFIIAALFSLFTDFINLTGFLFCSFCVFKELNLRAHIAICNLKAQIAIFAYRNIVRFYQTTFDQDSNPATVFSQRRVFHVVKILILCHSNCYFEKYRTQLWYDCNKFLDAITFRLMAIYKGATSKCTSNGITCINKFVVLLAPARTVNPSYDKNLAPSANAESKHKAIAISFPRLTAPVKRRW